MRAPSPATLPLALVGGMVLLPAACATHGLHQRELRKQAEGMKTVCLLVREGLRPWKRAVQARPKLPDQHYADHFGLPARQHRLGYVVSHGRRIAVQRFDPPETPRGTVLLLHGYLDHSGVHGRFVRTATDWGFRVIVYDMPGHGLSEGDRANIADFRLYGKALRDVLQAVDIAPPLHLVAHSTGCCAVVDALHRGGIDRAAGELGAVVLVAPLIHSWGEGPSTLGRNAVRPFLRRVPRVQRRVSHDREFMDLLRTRNPLKIRSIPLAWFDALRQWQEEVGRWQPLSRRALILQGTADAVVAWRKNLPLFKRLLPNARVHRIQGGYHHLLNEDAQRRGPVYDQLRRALRPNKRASGRTPAPPPGAADGE